VRLLVGRRRRAAEIYRHVLPGAASRPVGSDLLKGQAERPSREGKTALVVSSVSSIALLYCGPESDSH
jgi:hypothetical protein